MHRIMLYKDHYKVNIDAKDLDHWLNEGWSKVKKEKVKKKKSKED